ncbi:MAG: phosphoadenosine phosphosulfate reductase family protein [Chloroflexota bacterium]
MFDQYGCIHLGVSGGKDSTATLLWAVYESGIDLNKLVVTFCDTGNEDELTYRYIEKLSRTVHPIIRLQPKRDFWELAYFKKRFPSAKARFCTSELKIIPSMRYINKLSGWVNVLLLSGIRQSEGTAINGRGELDKFGLNESFMLDQYLPIYDFSLADVWAVHQRYLPRDFAIELIKQDPRLSNENCLELIKRQEDHGIPRNPLYDMGATRVGCFPCINSRKKEIRAMAKYRPERIDFISRHEIELGATRKKNGSQADYSSLFARKTVPAHLRSREITTKDGELMNVCTIWDVVKWSKTKRGGKQFTFDFYDFGEDVSLACDYRGACE